MSSGFLREWGRATSLLLMVSACAEVKTTSESQCPPGLGAERNSHNFSHTPRNDTQHPETGSPLFCGDFSMILVTQCA